MPISLQPLDLVLAAALLLINAGLSVWLGLGIARRLAVAALRMAVQLSLVGLVLKVLFAQNQWGPTLLAALVMAGFAGWEIHARQERRLSGWWSAGLGAGAMLCAGGIATAYGLLLLLRPSPWHDARHAIPLLGMILGNAMTGVALGLNTFTGDAVSARAAIGQPPGI